MNTFKDYAFYYNAFYKDKDYSNEARQIDKLFEKYKICDIKKVINLGCGTGKHDFELIKLGYELTGVDISSDMISVAKDRATEIEIDEKFIEADIRFFKSEFKYDAVISLFHVMSYQNSNIDIISALSSARRCLNRDGLLIFDVWYGPGVLTDLPQIRIKEVEDENYKLIRHAYPTLHCDDDIVDVNYDVYVIDKNNSKTEYICETHNMRYFFKPELEEFLVRTGFELMAVLDCNTLEKTTFNSWTAYFVAKAI